MTNKENIKQEDKKRVAVIGAGVSGVAVAGVWKKCGYDVTLYEATDQIGGQWANTYQGVRLQNTAPQYQFAEFPWPFKPDRHPTAEQVIRYIKAAVNEFGLDVKLQHTVTKMEVVEGGWQVSFNNQSGEFFDYVVLATGQYPGGEQKFVPDFDGLDKYSGQVVTNISSEEVFKGKRVAIVGFGKTALDFSAWSAPLANSTHHIFRTPRWTIPDHLLGIDYSRALFSRFGSEMMPSWGHSWALQKVLHKYFGFIVKFFWYFIASLFRFQHHRDAKLGSIDKNVLDTVMPEKSQFTADLRSASALAPDGYYEHIAHGRITPIRSEVTAFHENGVVLANGEQVDVDLVCLCCGNAAPSYDYLPAEYRQLLENCEGGPALYRHLIEPRIPNLGFAGYNHGFLHIGLAEMGAVWQIAAYSKDLVLPDEDEMLASAQRVAQWKRENSSFESTYNLAVNTRFQQHLDLLLRDLGLSPFRKMPNLLAEIFSRYDPTDYSTVVDQYLLASQSRKTQGQVRKVYAADA